MEQEISESDASSRWGVATKHSLMPNGELRFRLNFPDGNNLIRTVAGEVGGWQNAHFHTNLYETYVVESGWMAFAEFIDNRITIKILWPGDIFSSRPQISHNVYLPSNSVIHTIKHSSSGISDWKGDSVVDKLTKSISEQQIFEMFYETNASITVDSRFSGYILLYNNLDTLLWGIPTILAGGAAILIGFVGSIGKDKIHTVSPIILSSMLFVIGVLFLLGVYSTWRIRLHHTLAGQEIATMDPGGYFLKRNDTVKRKFPPSAPTIFIITYSLLGVVLLALSLIALFKNAWILSAIGWQPS